MVPLGSVARADHEIGHDHPFCAQGGGQVSAGGEGGTIPPEGAVTETNNGPIPDDTILIPGHLAERFGEAAPDPRDPDAGAQFIEVDADDIEGIEGTGSNGRPFHGGHGGGPGGGQGGSTFFGGGDGGCSPEFIPTRRDIDRPGVPGRRLPVTGGLAEQLGLMSGLMLSVGWLLSMVSRRKVELADTTGTSVAEPEKAVPVARRGQQVVSRLKEQMAGAWRSGNR